MALREKSILMKPRKWSSLDQIYPWELFGSHEHLEIKKYLIYFNKIKWHGSKWWQIMEPYAQQSKNSFSRVFPANDLPILSFAMILVGNRSWVTSKLTDVSQEVAFSILSRYAVQSTVILLHHRQTWHLNRFLCMDVTNSTTNKFSLSLINNLLQNYISLLIQLQNERKI